MPRTHRTYEKDIRQEAVNLLLGSGRPLKRVAAELGISGYSLRTWRDQALGKRRAAQAASPQAKGRGEAPLADAAGEPTESPEGVERSDSKSAACNARSNTCATSVNRAERDRLPQAALRVRAEARIKSSKKMP